MLVQIITENGQKKVIPLTADAGAGLPVGFIAPAYKKGNYSGWLYLDGRDTTGTSEELSTHYPLLYAYLGSNVLPDYREFALVGAEENTTDVYNASTNPNGTIHDHDVYTEGQAKDDQHQQHGHLGYWVESDGVSIPNQGSGYKFQNQINKLFVSNATGRVGTVTRGKRKAVYFYIKATSGLSENAQDNVINTLNEQRSYSTEEVNTGKKWINGKPIYRKVIHNVTLPNNTVISIQDVYENADTIISLGGTAFNGSITMSLPHIDFSANTTYMVSIYAVNKSYININSNSNTSAYKADIITEYTKTTD